MQRESVQSINPLISAGPNRSQRSQSLGFQGRLMFHVDMCFPCLGPSVPNHQDVRLMEWWMGCYWLVFHDRQSYPPWIGKRIWSKHVNFYQIPAWAEKMLRQTVGHLCSVSVNGSGIFILHLTRQHQHSSRCAVFPHFQGFSTRHFDAFPGYGSKWMAPKNG